MNRDPYTPSFSENTLKKFSNIRTWCVPVLAALLPACGGGSGAGAAPDTKPPTVNFTNPVNATSGVALNRKVTATFSEAMDPATIAAAFTLENTTTPAAVAGAVTYDVANRVATFAPTGNLTASNSFRASIATAVKDLAGNALAANKVWAFSTGTATDATAPTVLSTTPANAAIGVALNRSVNATFDESMDAATLTQITFTLSRGGTPVSGTVANVGATATFTPSGNLVPNALHTATVTTGAKDLSGNALAVNKVWTFTTGTAAALGPAPVVLGTSINFVILAKTGISTVPTSAVTGNIGVSPIDSTAITGFDPVTLDGSGVFSTASQVLAPSKIYAADYAPPTPVNLTTAVSDMELAYADAVSRAPDVTELGAGDIGGFTLAPGVYKWGTGLTIPTDLTLSGGADDVWIFQISGDVTMAGAKSVNLIGGAVSKNVFWQVAGGAGVTIGDASHFEGIILAQTVIRMGTSSSVSGRLLSQTAVNILKSTVTQPAP
jgi:hypothetical protein